jgi:hypothetical protein
MLVHSVSSAAGGFAAPQPAALKPAPAVSQPSAAAAAAPSSSSSTTFTAPVPAARPLAPNTARKDMDEHEFKDFLASLSRGLMKDRDQITKSDTTQIKEHWHGRAWGRDEANRSDVTADWPPLLPFVGVGLFIGSKPLLRLTGSPARRRSR